MESGNHVRPLLNQDSRVFVRRQYLSPWSYSPDDRSTNKHGFHRLAIHLDLGNAAVNLPSVAIPLNGQIHQPERGLRRILNFCRQQNRPGASPKNRLVFSELG
jgi:hypothetical protein